MPEYSGPTTRSKASAAVVSSPLIKNAGQSDESAIAPPPTGPTDETPEDPFDAFDIDTCVPSMTPNPALKALYLKM